MKLKRWSSNQILEYWKTIEDYPNYMISSLGRVKSLNYKRTGKVKIMKPHLNNKGYLQVTLYKNGKRKKFLVHRLITEVFIPNVDNKPYIDHIDTNPSNNNVKNLRWVTLSENMNNPLSRKKNSEAHKGKHHTEETKKKLSEIHNKRYANMSEEERKEKCGHQGEKNPSAKKVRCIETGEVFTTVTEASKWSGLKGTSDIAKQIQKRQKSAGKHPITNIPLHWEYVDQEIEVNLNLLIGNINISL